MKELGAGGGNWNLDEFLGSGLQVLECLLEGGFFQKRLNFYPAISVIAEEQGQKWG